MSRRLLTFGLILLLWFVAMLCVGVAGLAGYLSYAGPAHRIDEASYKRLDKGLSKAAVAEIFGKLVITGHLLSQRKVGGLSRCRTLIIRAGGMGPPSGGSQILH